MSEKELEKYNAQLTFYEIMAEYSKLYNDNKSLRGTCKALGKKVANQKEEIKNLTERLKWLRQNL